MLFNAIPRAKPYHCLYISQVTVFDCFFDLQVLHGCLQFMSLDVRFSPLMNANLASKSEFFSNRSLIWRYPFKIRGFIGLRQAFMALMQWAIDVPHK